MNNIPMRLRILIGIAVVLTPLVIWRVVSSGGPADPTTPDEVAIENDRKSGNVDGLVEKVKTLSPKLARKATRALGAVGAKSAPALQKILIEDKRPEVRQQAAHSMALAIKASVETNKPIPKKLTTALVAAASKDESPEVRASAIKAMGQVYDYDNMTLLLNKMDDDDLNVRRKAHDAVSRIFGRRYEFNANGTPKERRAVIAVIDQDWRAFKKQIGDYHDVNRNKPKSRVSRIDKLNTPE